MSDDLWQGERARTAPDAASARADAPKTLRIRFLSDAYNYRPGAQRGDLATSAAALRAWVDALRALFGDLRRAWTLAADARLTARSPSWEEIEAIVLGVETAKQPTEDDLRSQRESVALALERIGDYARVFEIALPAIIAGSLVAAGPGPARRHLAGLRAVSRLYGTVIRKSRDRGMSELDRLGQSLESLTSIGLTIEAPAPRPKTDFVLQPEGLADFARVIATAQRIAWRNDGQRPGADDGFTADLARAFWAEFTLVGGTLYRRTLIPGAEGDVAGLRGLPSGIEILYAALHGGVPIIPTDPAWLSVAELTRIWVLRQDVELGANEVDFAGYALQALRSTPPDGKLRERWGGYLPMLVLDPADADSPSWYWRPEAGVLAICSIPPDAWAGQSPADTAANLFQHLQSSAGDAVSDFRPLPLHAIEVTSQRMTDKWVISLPTLYYLIYYGAMETPPADAQPYARNASGLTGLVDLIYRQRPDLFTGITAAS